MKKILFSILFLFLFSSVCSAQNFLGVSVLGAQINTGGGGGGYEDFTTYTETDPATYLSVTSTRVTGTQVNTDIDAYVYKDFGVDYFNGNFTHEGEFSWTASSGDYQKMGFWGLSNSVDDLSNATDVICLSLYDFWSTDNTTIKLYQLSAGSVDAQDGYNIDWGTYPTIYWTTVRDDAFGTYGKVTVTIYSDEAKTNPLDTLVITLTERHDFRYLYTIWSSDNNNNAEYHSGHSDNFDLN